MSGQPGDDRAAQRRKRLIAITAALVGLTIVVPLAGALLHQVFGTEQPPPARVVPSLPTAAESTIKPLMVRSVISAEVAAPDQCLPAALAVPEVAPGTLRTCNFAKTELYTLGADDVRLQLTAVNPMPSLAVANSYTVQVLMTAESATTFHDFTAANVGKQVAFVRAGVVVAAPAIREPISGQSLELSGALTADDSAEITRLLREES